MRQTRGLTASHYCAHLLHVAAQRAPAHVQARDVVITPDDADGAYLQVETATDSVMPGLVGMHHVSFAVTDVGRTLAWYKRVFGVRPSIRLEADGEELGASMGLPPVSIQVAFIDLAGVRIELLAFDAPHDAVKGAHPRRCDLGAAHICLQVDDIHAAHAHLLRWGVEVCGEPFHSSTDALDGSWFLYFDDPDGLHYELHQPSADRPGAPAPTSRPLPDR